MNTKRKILAVVLLASLTVGLVGLLSSCGLIFKPITYTVSYKYCVEPLCRGGDCEHEKWEMGTYGFTVKDGVLGTPSLPNKFGYNSTWRGVELTAGDKQSSLLGAV